MYDSPSPCGQAEDHHATHNFSSPPSPPPPNNCNKVHLPIHSCHIICATSLSPPSAGDGEKRTLSLPHHQLLDSDPAGVIAWTLMFAANTLCTRQIAVTGPGAMERNKDHTHEDKISWSHVIHLDHVFLTSVC